jgi:hypothetical protein
LILQTYTSSLSGEPHPSLPERNARICSRLVAHRYLLAVIYSLAS